MNCNNCNAQNLDNSKFCSSCGLKVEEIKKQDQFITGDLETKKIKWNFLERYNPKKIPKKCDSLILNGNYGQLPAIKNGKIIQTIVWDNYFVSYDESAKLYNCESYPSLDLSYFANVKNIFINITYKYIDDINSSFPIFTIKKDKNVTTINSLVKERMIWNAGA